MPTFGSSLRLNRLPVIGLVPEVSATAPSTPAVGQLWTDTSVTPNVVRVWNGTAWVQINNLAVGTTAGTVAAGDDARLSDQRTPLDNSVTSAKIVDGTIVDGDIAAANKDGAAATPSLRTLGTTATSAAAGNDARLSDTRTPTAGSVVDASVSATAAIAESKLSLASDAAATTASRRTIGTGALQAMAGNRALNTITAPAGDLSLASFKITNLGAPTAASDAARLQDVQNAAAGIDLKPSVRAASTGNVAVATGLANGQVLDGVTLVTGDRVLLKNQTAGAENGSYVVPASGAATRTTDSINPNSLWLVEEGTANADTSWMVTTNGTITLGTTALTLAQFGAPGSVSGTANRITVSGTVIDIASNYVGQTSLTTLGTITTGVWNGTVIGLPYGGLGVDASSTAGKTTARTNLNATQTGYAATNDGAGGRPGALTAGTPVTFTHNLGTQDVIAQVRDASTNEYIYLDVINASTNTVTVTSGVAYAANALRIVVLPVA